MKKIRKNTARKLFNSGETLIITPCKCAPGGVWLTGFKICKNDFDYCDFDALINEFEYYNCNSELGKYTAFYIPGEGARAC